MKKFFKYLLNYDHWIIVAMALVLTLLLFLLMHLLGIRNLLNGETNASLMQTYYNNNDIDTLVRHDNVVIVDIGDANREEIARALQLVDSMQPVVVGLDVVFKDRKDPRTDSVLIDVLANMKCDVVMAEWEDAGGLAKSFFADSLRLESGRAHFKNDSVITEFQLHQQGTPAFATLLFEKWRKRNGETIHVTKDDLASVFLKYELLNNYTIIKADSLPGKSTERLRNRVVLLGDASTDYKDVYVTPKGPMHGVIVHALCFETLNSMEHLPYAVPMLLNIMLALLLGYLLELLLSYIHVKLAHSKSLGAKFFRDWLENSSLTNVVLLVFVVVLTILMLNAQLNHGRFYNVPLIFTMLVMVLESRNIYQAAVRTLRQKYNWKLLKDSLIVD